MPGQNGKCTWPLLIEQGAMCVCCPESPETAVEDRREIGPTYFFAPPRVFENLLTQVMVRMEDAGWLKKRMFHYFLRVARRCGEVIMNCVRKNIRPRDIATRKAFSAP